MGQQRSQDNVLALPVRAPSGQRRLLVSIPKDKLWAVKTGIDTAWRQQRMALGLVGVDVTDRVDARADIVHINWYSPLSRFYLEQARRRGQRTIVVAHTGNDIEGTIGGPEFFQLASKRYIGRFYNRADLVVAVSEYLKETLERAPFSVSRPISVVSNGVDRKRFAPRTSGEASTLDGARRPVIACAAQIIPRKGVADFLEVARRMPDCDFVWYGSTAAAWFSNGFRMKHLVRTCPPNVRFPGFTVDLPERLRSADVFFFPSLEETQSIAILEAASLGLPIVARPLPAYRGWLLGRSRPAALFGEGPDAFVAALRSMLVDAGLRRAVTAEALAVAEENALEQVGRRFLALYGDLGARRALAA